MIERIDQLDIEETEIQKKEIVVAISKKSLRIFQAMFPTSAEGRKSPEYSLQQYRASATYHGLGAPIDFHDNNLPTGPFLV
jgi:hypothetical protein